MKVYGKYLVMARCYEGDRNRVAASFMTKKEAVETLDRIFKKRINNNLWEDKLGQQFFVIKNTKEYK